MASEELFVRINNVTLKIAVLYFLGTTTVVPTITINGVDYQAAYSDLANVEVFQPNTYNVDFTFNHRCG
ncbi:hypothetical protein O9992_01060 [Vibrio lentus]|nr:hypothetical protein [Vibrio lentus]